MNVITNGAGTVNLHRVFSDSGTDTSPKTLIFSGAGSQTIDYGAVYHIWRGTYAVSGPIFTSIVLTTSKLATIIHYCLHFP